MFYGFSQQGSLVGKQGHTHFGVYPPPPSCVNYAMSHHDHLETIWCHQLF